LVAFTKEQKQITNDREAVSDFVDSKMYDSVLTSSKHASLAVKWQNNRTTNRAKELEEARSRRKEA
jgi:hypothetical protein